MTDLVIFALEGVLVDCERTFAEIRAAVLGRAGLSISADELAEDFAGLPFRDILLALERNREVPLQASLLGEAEALIDRRLGGGLPAMEGAREALGRTPNRCMISDEPSKRTEALLAASGLKPFLREKAIFSSAALGLKGRPAPDLLLHAAEASDADADACFVVESSTPGILAARAAGMRAIGFTGGAQAYPGLADRRTEAGAETVVRRLGDLPGVVAALGEWSDAV